MPLSTDPPGLVQNRVCRRLQIALSIPAGQVRLAALEQSITDNRIAGHCPAIATRVDCIQRPDFDPSQQGADVSDAISGAGSERNKKALARSPA